MKVLYVEFDGTKYVQDNIQIALESVKNFLQSVELEENFEISVGVTDMTQEELANLPDN